MKIGKTGEKSHNSCSLCLQNGPGTTQRLPGPGAACTYRAKCFQTTAQGGCVQRACWEWSQVGINAQNCHGSGTGQGQQPPRARTTCAGWVLLLRTVPLLPLSQMAPHRGQNSKGWGRLKDCGGCSTIATDRTTPTSASSFKIRWLEAEYAKLLSGVMS